MLIGFLRKILNNRAAFVTILYTSFELKQKTRTKLNKYLQEHNYPEIFVFLHCTQTL